MTVTLALAATMTYTSVAPSVTYAETSVSDIDKEMSKQKSLQDELSAQKKAVQAELDKINQKQLDLTGNISDTQEEINKNKTQIEKHLKEIEAIQKRIEERKDLLKDRLVSMYKNGGSVNYLDVLLGSKNFGDFLDRTKALYTIATQDQKIIDDQKKDQEAVTAKKKDVEKKQTSNIAKMAQLKKTLAEITDLQEQRKTALAALESKEDDVAGKLSQLSATAADLKKDQADKAKGEKAEQAAPETTQVSYSTKSSSGNNSSANNYSAESDDASFTISASVATGGVQGILNYGNKFIGRSRYVWGASNPSAGEFDCSGFVNAAFAANGIRLGGNTSSLVNKGRAVSYGEAKPGDLIFFDTYKTNGHVAIYLGGGRFIGSQSSTGVAVASVNNSYWGSHFRGVVRRVLN